MSVFQEMWTYAHVKRGESKRREQDMDLVKLLCSFIDPKRAKDMFSQAEVSESEGFMDDIKKMDPNFVEEDYEAVLKDLEEAE